MSTIHSGRSTRLRTAAVIAGSLLALGAVTGGEVSLTNENSSAPPLPGPMIEQGSDVDSDSDMLGAG